MTDNDQDDVDEWVEELNKSSDGGGCAEMMRAAFEKRAKKESGGEDD